MSVLRAWDEPQKAPSEVTDVRTLYSEPDWRDCERERTGAIELVTLVHKLWYDTTGKRRATGLKQCENRP